jgi:hypothetical protein
VPKNPPGTPQAVFRPSHATRRPATIAGAMIAETTEATINKN